MADGSLFVAAVLSGGEVGVSKWSKEIKKENGDKCIICEYSRNPNGLHFHHIDPSTKIDQVGVFSNEGETRREAQKCILVCANCHSEIHSGKFESEYIESLPRAVSLDYIFDSPEIPKRTYVKKEITVEKITEVEVIKEIIVFDLSTNDNGLSGEVAKLIDFIHRFPGESLSKNFVISKLIGALNNSGAEVDEKFLKLIEKK